MSGTPIPLDNTHATAEVSVPEQRRPLSRCESPPAPRVVQEIGGRPGPEPTRYGDWEKAGRCIDF
jgi:hypothetical protein